MGSARTLAQEAQRRRMGRRQLAQRVRRSRRQRDPATHLSRRAFAPRPQRAPFIGMGISLLGPTLMHWGTEAQKQNHLPKILKGEEVWCQGYSEPDAGSDLARCRPARSRTATTSSSTGRKCGPRWRSMRTRSSCWCAPTPRRRSIRGSAICWSICIAPESRCVRWCRSPAARASTKYFSKMCACRVKISSAR